MSHGEKSHGKKCHCWECHGKNCRCESCGDLGPTESESGWAVRGAVCGLLVGLGVWAVALARGGPVSESRDWMLALVGVLAAPIVVFKVLAPYASDYEAQMRKFGPYVRNSAAFFGPLAAVSAAVISVGVAADVFRPSGWVLQICLAVAIAIPALGMAVLIWAERRETSDLSPSGASS